jgi:hypothetical protein
MLEQHGKIVCHEFFYNGHNAQRAFRKAREADGQGFLTLESELENRNWGTQMPRPRFTP